MMIDSSTTHRTTAVNNIAPHITESGVLYEITFFNLLDIHL